jgi:hypothetical protein
MSLQLPEDAVRVADRLVLDEGSSVPFNVTLPRAVEFDMFVKFRVNTTAPTFSDLLNDVTSQIRVVPTTFLSDGSAKIPSGATSFFGEVRSTDDSILTGDFNVDAVVEFSGSPVGGRPVTFSLPIQLLFKDKHKEKAGVYFGATTSVAAANAVTLLGLDEGATTSTLLLVMTRHMYALRVASEVWPADVYTELLHNQTVGAKSLPMPVVSTVDSSLRAGLTSLSVGLAVPNDNFAVGERKYFVRLSGTPIVASNVTLPADHVLRRVLSTMLTLTVTDDDTGSVALAALTISESKLLVDATNAGGTALSSLKTRPAITIKEGKYTQSTDAVARRILQAQTDAQGNVFIVSGTGTNEVLELGLTRRPIGTLWITVTGPADVQFILQSSTKNYPLKAISSSPLTFAVMSENFTSGSPVARVLVLSKDDDLAQGKRRVQITATVSNLAPGASSSELDRFFVSSSTVVTRDLDIDDDDVEQVTRAFGGVTTFTVSSGTTSAVNAVEAIELAEGTASVSRGLSGAAVSKTATFSVSVKSQPFKRPSVAGAYVDPANPPAGTVTVTLSAAPKLCAYGSDQFALRPTACSTDADCQAMRPEFSFIGDVAVPSSINKVVVGKCLPARELTFSPASFEFSTSSWKSAISTTVTAANDPFDNVGSALARGNVASGQQLRVYSALMIATITGDIAASQTISVPVIIHDDDESGVEIVPVDSDYINAEGRLSIPEKDGSTGRKYSLKLKSKPRGEVVVTPSIPNSFVGTMKVNPASLSFSTTNYMTAQNVEFTVSDNLVDEGDGRNETLTHTVSSTNDPIYAALPSSAVPSQRFYVINDDRAGIAITTPVRALQLGAAGFLAVVLKSQPLSTVTVAVAAPASVLSSRPLVIPSSQKGKTITVKENELDITVDPTFVKNTVSVTFDKSNWNKPQIINVLAPRTSSISQAASVSITAKVSSATTTDARYLTLVNSETLSLGTPQQAVIAAVGRDISLDGTTNAPFYIDEGGTATLTVFHNKTALPAEKPVTAVNVKGNCLSKKGGKVSAVDFCFSASDCSSETYPDGADCEQLITVTIPPGGAKFTAANPSVALSVTATDDSIQRALYFPVAMQLMSGTTEIGTVQVMVKDNDGAGLLIGKPDDRTITEDGSKTFTYNITLKTQPASTVTITPLVIYEGRTTAENGYGVTFEPSELTFLPGDFNTAPAKMVKVTAKDDRKQNTASGGPVTIKISHHETSADPDYSGLDTSDAGLITITSVDNDVAAILFCKTTATEPAIAGSSAIIARKCTEPYTGPMLTITEAAASQKFFVGLATDPTAGNMAVRLSADHAVFVTSSGSFADRLELSFTDGSSSLTPVEISVLNDGTDSGPRSGSIVVTSSLKSAAACGVCSCQSFVLLQSRV